METKRKRKNSVEFIKQSSSAKRKCDLAHVSRRVRHPVLRSYYLQVVTLRQYLISKLPSGSTKRRRRIALLGSDTKSTQTCNATAESCSRTKELAELLDSTLVGIDNACESVEDRKFRASQLLLYTQELVDSALGPSYNVNLLFHNEVRNVMSDGGLNDTFHYEVFPFLTISEAN